MKIAAKRAHRNGQVVVKITFSNPKETLHFKWSSYRQDFMGTGMPARRAHQEAEVRAALAAKFPASVAQLERRIRKTDKKIIELEDCCVYECKQDSKLHAVRIRVEVFDPLLIIDTTFYKEGMNLLRRAGTTRKLIALVKYGRLRDALRAHYSHDILFNDYEADEMLSRHFIVARPALPGVDTIRDTRDTDLLS